MIEAVLPNDQNIPHNTQIMKKKNKIHYSKK